MAIRFSVVAVAMLGLTACSGLVQASDIYIAQNASGADNGKDCSDAYPYTFFNNPGNWGSEAPIGPGTTVHLCGTFAGTPGQQLLTAQGSGSEGNPITIKFESGATLTAPYWSGAGAIIVSHRSYITIDGGPGGTIQDTANGTGLNYHQTSVGIQALPCNNCEIENLTIQNLYVHAACEGSGGCDQSVDQTQVNAIQFQGSNLLIHDNVLHDVGWALYQNYTNDSNVQIYNNNIYDMDHGLACAGAAYTVSSEYVYGNHFHDMANWDTGASDRYHHDGIHCFNGSGGKIQNLYVYNNLFDGNEGNCCVTAWMFLESPLEGTPWGDATSTAHVWNNVVIGSLDLPNGQLYLGAGTESEFLNNTIMVAAPNNGICIAASGGATAVTIENNILEGCNQVIGAVGARSYSSIDYNLYGNAHGGNPIWQYGSTNSSTLAGWQQKCSCDTHSIASLNSSLAALSNTGVPSTGFSGTASGLDLTSSATGSLAMLASDTTAGDTRSPSLRPTSGPWTIGAYTSTTNTSAALPAPPTDLSAVLH